MQTLVWCTLNKLALGWEALQLMARDRLLAPQVAYLLLALVVGYARLFFQRSCTP